MVRVRVSEVRCKSSCVAAGTDIKNGVKNRVRVRLGLGLGLG
jgi:hypothetical protein